MKKDKTQLVKVLVGSTAHGLATPDSDADYRGVHVEPTSKIVEIGYKLKDVSWVEGEKEDNTSYELGAFIKGAINGSPNELEIFKAPLVSWNKDGLELMELFNKIWHPDQVYVSFTNYANNKRKNMLNANDRKTVYKSGYNCIRVLYNLCDLLKNKTFNLEVLDEGTQRILKDIKEGNWTTGQVIDLSYVLEERAKSLLKICSQKPNLDYVNEFYLKLRKKYWEV